MQTGATRATGARTSRIMDDLLGVEGEDDLFDAEDEFGGLQGGGNPLE